MLQVNKCYTVILLYCYTCLQRAKEEERARKAMVGKAVAVVPVRTQVVPAESQDGLEEEGEKVGQRGGNKIKVRTLSNLLDIFVGWTD